MDPLSGETIQPVLTFPSFLTGVYFYEKEFASRRENYFLIPSKEQRTFRPGKQKGSHKTCNPFQKMAEIIEVYLCVRTV